MIDFHLHLTEENCKVAPDKRGKIQKKQFSYLRNDVFARNEASRNEQYTDEEKRLVFIALIAQSLTQSLRARLRSRDPAAATTCPTPRVVALILVVLRNLAQERVDRAQLTMAPVAGYLDTGQIRLPACA
jgi:hypothetical protein